MEHGRNPPPNPVWHALYDAVVDILERAGRRYEAGQGDWYLLEEDTGQEMQQIELVNLDLLRPDLIRSLQELLVRHPDWVISVRVEGTGKGGQRIGMGLMICSDRIIDELRRDLLPERFRSMRFG